MSAFHRIQEEEEQIDDKEHGQHLCPKTRHARLSI